MKFAKQQSSNGTHWALSGAALMLLTAGFGATVFAVEAPRTKSEPVTFSNQFEQLARDVQHTPIVHVFDAAINRKPNKTRVFRPPGTSHPPQALHMSP